MLNQPTMIQDLAVCSALKYLITYTVVESMKITIMVHNEFFHNMAIEVLQYYVQHFKCYGIMYNK